MAQQQRQPDKGESAPTAGSDGRSAGIESGLPPTQNKVVGVICAGDLAVERDTVKDTLAKGMTQRPDAVWVCLEPKSDRLTHDVMISLGLDPVVLPLNDAWRSRDERAPYDLRRQWRDLEMLALCDELIVFHKRTSNSPWRDRARDSLFVVELGPEPKCTASTESTAMGASAVA